MPLVREERSSSLAPLLFLWTPPGGRQLLNRVRNFQVHEVQVLFLDYNGFQDNGVRVWQGNSYHIINYNTYSLASK